MKGWRQDKATANGQADCASPSTRSASPGCPADVISSMPDQAKQDEEDHSHPDGPGRLRSHA